MRQFGIGLELFAKFGDFVHKKAKNGLENKKVLAVKFPWTCLNDSLSNLVTWVTKSPFLSESVLIGY